MENRSIVNGIYLVAGLRFHPDIPSFLSAIEQSFLGGIRLFQLRTKQEIPDRDLIRLARQVREITRRHQVAFFINDRPDIARLCDADGLHLGPDDLPADEARKIVGDMIIGKSSHSIAQAESALTEDIDYLSFGPVFETDCKEKPDSVVGTQLLQTVLDMTEKPVVAIGGITLENMATVMATGVGCCGLIRGIMQADDLRKTAETYQATFMENSP